MELRRQWVAIVGFGNDSNIGFLDFKSGEKISVSSFYALGGKVWVGRATLATVSAGLGLVQVHTYQDGGLFTPSRDHRHQNTVGVPLQVQGFVVVRRSLGLGLTGQLNLNAAQTTASLAISLALGHLPTRQLARAEQAGH